jgi:peptidoglycan/xylan/chitin deacetylase (PgdA/CDA1 family)
VVAVKTDAPNVILTYDDGPDPRGTVEILEALAARKATATFFVLLTRARLHSSLLHEIAAGGHEIALHGMDHTRLTSLPNAEVRLRTAAAKAELEDLTGGRIKWMRPPYGAQSMGTWHAIKASGLDPVMWSRTTWDSRDLPQRERVSKAVAGAKRGAIMLAHDGFAAEIDGVNDGPEPSLDRGELTGLVLDELNAAGLSGCSLGHSLLDGTPVRAAWFTRRVG